MSILTHRCTDCEHPDYFHNVRTTPGGDVTVDCCHGSCRCTRSDFTNAAPDVAYSFTVPRRPHNVLLKPGTRFDPALKSCSCDQCVERYQEITGLQLGAGAA